MARELDRITLNDNNVTYIVNPFFFKDEDITVENLKSYTDVEKYQLEGKIIHEYSGRGKTYLVTDRYNNRIVIRHYWRGGMMFKLLKDKFFRLSENANRSEKEFDILQTMRKMGLPVPRPIVSRVVKSGLFVTNDIILQEIPGAKTVAKILQERNLTDIELGKIGAVIGQLLTAGILHTDLNISNILLDGAGNIWIIDFDKCFLREINKKKYKKTLSRLERSFEKESKESPNFYWTKDDFVKLQQIIESSFNRGY